MKSGYSKYRDVLGVSDMYRLMILAKHLNLYINVVKEILDMIRKTFLVILNFITLSFYYLFIIRIGGREYPHRMYIIYS